MTDSIQALRKDLSRFQAVLRGGTFISFSAEERDLLLADSEKLTQKLDDAAESVLTVGLVGGTGVGKSSLMNALAGFEIASTSHRRPHTDQVLVYRHSLGELPAPLDKALLYSDTSRGMPTRPPGRGGRDMPTAAGHAPPDWREITHEAETIRQIILCDLPDFDSLVGEHRLRVLHFLEHLDVIVWVASPEKYADARFHDFLREAPKARENYYFVLNKADILFQNQQIETGYGELAKIADSFMQHLMADGVEQPLIYALSAKEAVQSHGPAPWNQFTVFRHQLFQLRTSKEIMSIKSANLDVEVRRFLLVLKKETLLLEKMHQLVRDFSAALEEGRAEWVETGKRAFESWLENHLRKEAFLHLAVPSSLVGPGRAVASLIREWERWTAGGESRKGFPGFSTESGALISLQRQLERQENLMVRDLLYHGLPSPFIGHLQSAFDSKREWEDVSLRLQDLASMRLESFRTQPGRTFRVFQYGAYLLLTVLLLFALGGEEAWQNMLEHPGLAALTGLALAMVKTVFSTAGLAAFGSYILLQAFLAFRFHARYKKFLQRRTQKFIESLKLELERVWGEELDFIITRLRQYEREIEEQITAISALHRAPKEG